MPLLPLLRFSGTSPPDHAIIKGYKVYQRAPEGQWPAAGVDVGLATTYSAENVKIGSTVFAVSAYTNAAESDKSNEAIAKVPPSAPKNLRITVIVQVE
jgi:hypothetical protein